MTAPISTKPSARRGAPVAVGIGLRHPHVDQVLADQPAVGWLEVHTENYLVAGGPRLRQLELTRERYEVSFHGVGLSLGSAEPVSMDHLRRIRAAVDRFDPCLVSEHVAWSVEGGVYVNDLLPLPYTEEALQAICANVERAQDTIGRRILVENPSSYLRFKDSRIPECEFVAEIAKRTGCGLVLDVNNVYVSAFNHGFDADAYFDALPADAIGEVHLAGHASVEIEGVTVLIDDHASAVIPAVWELYERALARFGPRPTLVEWDNDIPPLATLLAEARAADARLRAAAARAAA